MIIKKYTIIKKDDIMTTTAKTWTYGQYLAMEGPRPEEWCGHHHRALAELVDAVDAVGEVTT